MIRIYNLSGVVVVALFFGCANVPAPIEGHFNKGVEHYDGQQYAKAIEEYVPMITPQIKAIEKPLITSPPKKNKAINANNVVTDVITVRDKV